MRATRSQKSFEYVRLEPFSDAKLEIMDMTELPFVALDERSWVFAVAGSDFSAVRFDMKRE